MGYGIWLSCWRVSGGSSPLVILAIFVLIAGLRGRYECVVFLVHFIMVSGGFIAAVMLPDEVLHFPPMVFPYV